VTAMYLLYHRSWRFLPLLGVGHLVYAIAGAPWHDGDLLWVFNKIPYASLGAYGQGKWWHFIEQLYYAAGFPLYVLGCLGMLTFGIIFFSKNVSNPSSAQHKPELALIMGYFLALIGGHSAFWALGIFNSFGMTRVLNSIMPEFALLGCLGAGFFLTKIQSPITQKMACWAIVAIIVAMPFSNNPAAISFPKNFVRNADQRLLDDVNQLINARFPDALIYHSHPCVPYYLGRNPFDTTAIRPLIDIQYKQQLLPNSILVWDSWFSVIDHKIPLETLERDPRLELVQTFQTHNPAYSYVVFAVKP
jgi:hypothetical protein